MYARSPMFDAPERAEKVLRRYRDLCCQNSLEQKPDEYSYSLLLKAWYVQLKNCSVPCFGRSIPNIDHFVLRLRRSTSKRDDGIHQALSRLNWMRQLDEDAAFPDVVKVSY
jgi:hypothetical protein